MRRKISFLQGVGKSTFRPNPPVESSGGNQPAASPKSSNKSVAPDTDGHVVGRLLPVETQRELDAELKNRLACSTRRVQEIFEKTSPSTVRFKSKLGPMDPNLVSETQRAAMKDEEYRDWYLRHVLELKPETDPNDYTIFVCLHSVKANAFRGYASHWNKMRSRGFSCWTSAGFIEYQNKYKHEVGGGSENSWAAATSLLQDTLGLNEDKKSAQRLRYQEGSRMLKRLTKPEKLRGNISQEKMLEMLKVPIIHGNKTYRDGLLFQWVMGLRSSEVSDCRVSNLTVVDNEEGVKTYCYVGPRLKAKGANRFNGAQTVNYGDPEFFAKVGNIIRYAQSQPGRGEDPLLFPGWTKRKANQLVKEAAGIDNWEAEVTWVNHSQRHGAAASAATKAKDQTAAGRLRAVKNRINNSSPSMQAHYGQDLALRIAKQKASTGAVNQNNKMKMIKAGGSKSAGQKKKEVTKKGKVEQKRGAKRK